MRARPALRSVLPAMLATISLLALCSPASADVGETIILRCTHGQSLSGFSQQAYSRALKELSADAEEYTDCSSLIRQAQLAAAGGDRGGGTSTPTPVAIAPTPSEKQAITHAAHVSSAPVPVNGQAIHPGVVHANVASAINSLPTPLLATLVFMLAGVVLLMGGVLRNRLRGRRSN